MAILLFERGKVILLVKNSGLNSEKLNMTIKSLEKSTSQQKMNILSCNTHVVPFLTLLIPT